MASLKDLLNKKPAPASGAAPVVRLEPSPAPAPRPGLADEPRQLGNTERGTDVPFEFPSEKSSDAAKQWLLARQQPETKLGIVIEPGETSDHAWLALENPADPGRMLFLFRLPLLNRSQGANPY